MKPKTRIQDDPDFKLCYWTRIGILCEDQDPTPEQRAIAFVEATQYVKERIEVSQSGGRIAE